MNGKARITLLAALVAPLMVSGCASKPKVSDRDTEAYAAVLLAEHADVAAKAQKQYVALVAEDKQITAQKQHSIDTDEVDVDFLGTPQELLQTFAYRYGYRYIESGQRRSLKNINVRVNKASPIDVLRNVGHQITNGADLVLDKNAKVIRVIYKPVSIGQRG